MKTRFIFETVEITDVDTDVSRIAKVITDTKETYSYEELNEIVDLLNELNNELEEASAFIIEQRKENKTLKEENEQLKNRLNKEYIKERSIK